MRHHSLALPVALLAALCPGSSAQAQSLIVGIPNADVTERGRVALTHESQALDLLGTPSWNSFSFITYGLAEHLELSASLVNLSAPRAGELVLGAGFKYVLPIAPARTRDWEPRITFGTTALFSLDRAAVGGWAYAHASARLPVTRTRLTAGVSYGSELLFGAGNNPVSFIAGVEQPITPWLWFVADWYSGQHTLGALIPAVQFNVGRSAIILGYKIDNDRVRPKDGPIVEVMIAF